MDWLPELDDDDLATLLEALQAWEFKDQASEMFDDVISAIVSDERPGAAKAVEDIVRRKQRERLQLRTVRKERSVLLQAKLLTLRNRRRVERATSSS